MKTTKEIAGRRGFTLVELLVTMGIMLVLAALVAVSVGNAEESAQVAHTRALIARIHTLLMDRYESYRWRRLPIQIQPGSTPAQAATLRCNALRELMRIELPDRWYDVKDPPAIVPRSAASTSYLAALTSANPSDTTYQGADCLYLIVTMGLEENDVLENFAQSDIGVDPKNRGCACFVDSWGNPIQFLRWAPGFNSPLQPATPLDRDQTDPTGVYGSPPNTFALYPLIYSAGPDGYYDILPDLQYATSPGQPLRYSQTNPPNNPFVNVGTPNAMGTPTVISPPNTTGTLGSYDNITNQSLDLR